MFVYFCQPTLIHFMITLKRTGVYYVPDSEYSNSSSFTPNLLSQFHILNMMPYFMSSNKGLYHTITELYKDVLLLVKESSHVPQTIQQPAFRLWIKPSAVVINNKNKEQEKSSWKPLLFHHRANHEILSWSQVFITLH